MTEGDEMAAWAQWVELCRYKEFTAMFDGQQAHKEARYGSGDVPRAGDCGTRKE